MAQPRKEGQLLSSCGASRRGNRLPFARGPLALGVPHQLPLPFQAWAEQKKVHSRASRDPQVAPDSPVGFTSTRRAHGGTGLLSQSALLPPLPRNSGRRSAPATQGGQLLLLGEGLLRKKPPWLPHMPQGPWSDQVGDRGGEDLGSFTCPQRSAQLDPETEKRILAWLEEVNQSLFAPMSCSCKQEVEADTSIKIVYLGD